MGDQPVGGTVTRRAPRGRRRWRSPRAGSGATRCRRAVTSIGPPCDRSIGCARSRREAGSSAPAASQRSIIARLAPFSTSAPVRRTGSDRLVGEGEPLRVERAERPLGMHLFGTRRRTLPSSRRRRCRSASSSRRRGRASRRATGPAGCRAGGTRPARPAPSARSRSRGDVALRIDQVDAFGRPAGGGGGDRVGAAAAHPRRDSARRSAVPPATSPAKPAKDSGPARCRAAIPATARTSRAGERDRRQQPLAPADHQPPPGQAAPGGGRRMRLPAAVSRGCGAGWRVGHPMAHATPARSRSCTCSMPIGRPPASTTNSAVTGRRGRSSRAAPRRPAHRGRWSAARCHDLADRAFQQVGPMRGAGRRR